MNSLLERFLKVMEVMCLAICNILLALMVVGGMINILVRELLGQGIIWVFQTSMILFAWSVFLGIFVVYRRRADVAVDFIVLLFSRPLQRVAKWLVTALTVYLFGTILFQAPKLMELQSGLLETIVLPRYVIALPLFFSCALIIVHSVKTAFGPIDPSTQPTAH